MLGESGLQLLDPCSATQFQLNMILPSAKNTIQEPDIEYEIIDS